MLQEIGGVKMRKKLLLLMMTGILIASVGCSAKKTDTAVTQEKMIAVETIKVQKGTIEDSFSYVGKLKGQNEIMVSPKSAGKAKTVNVELGMRVKAGQVLATLDGEDIQKQIRTLQAQLKQIDAGIQVAQVGLENVTGGAYQQQLIQAETSLKTAKEQYDQAKKSKEDGERLVEAGAMTTKDYERLQNSYTLAQNQLNAAEQSLEILKGAMVQGNQKTAQAQLNQTRTSRESVMVQIQNLQDSLKDLNIVSPIDGIIAARNIDAGEMVSPQLSPFTVVNLDTMFLTVNVTEQAVNTLQVGHQAKVTIDSLGARIVEGTIHAISPSADDRTLGYTVKVKVPNPDQLIKGGMLAKVDFTKVKKTDAIVIPRDAVLSEGQENFVFIVENAHAKKIVVKTGLDNGRDIEILSGLAESQELIIKGQQFVEDQIKVNILSNEEEAKGEEK